MERRDRSAQREGRGFTLRKTEGSKADREEARRGEDRRGEAGRECDEWKKVQQRGAE